MLNGLGSDLSELIRTIFITRILSEEMAGQWGYSPRAYYVEERNNPYFVDSDDTAFALKSLRLMGIFKKTDAFDSYLVDVDVESLRFPLFLTFANKNVSPHITCSPAAKNNLLIHPEVNANIFQFLHGTDKQRLMNDLFVTKLQKTNRLLPNYFYPIEFYGTYMFIMLAETYGLAHEAKGKAIEGIIKSQKADGSFGSSSDPLATAFALKSLQIAGYEGESIDRGIKFLLEKQTFKGYWKSDSVIWKFHHDDGDIWTAYDSNHIIATAMCMSVLRNSID